MIGDVSHAEHIYIVCGYTDMRKAIDGLAAIVQQNFGLDVFQEASFCSAGNDVTASKLCSGKRTVLYCFTNAWKTVNTNGHVIPMKRN